MDVEAEKGMEVWRTSLVREKGPTLPAEYRKLRGPEVVARAFHSLWGDDPRERFVVFFLDSQNRIRGISEVSVGIVDASVVHARETFRGAILANATSIILAHNHPSGDTTPSPEDRTITRQMKEAGKLLGIRVLDHLVVGWDGDGRVTWEQA